MEIIRDREWIKGSGELGYRKRVLMDGVPPAVNLIEDIVVPAGGKIPPHAHGSTKEIFYVTGGKAAMTAGGEEFDVNPGDMILVEVGEEHSFTNHSGDEFKMLVLKIKFKKDDALLYEVKK